MSESYFSFLKLEKFLTKTSVKKDSFQYNIMFVVVIITFISWD